MKNPVLIGIIAIVIGAAAGFFGGMQYQKSQASTTNTTFGNRQAGGGQFARQGGGRRGFGGATIGEIVSQDPTSITVKLQDGSSKIVNISDSTTISKSATGSKSDLTKGARVMVFGTAGSDGSINAQNVQLNPMMRMPGTTGTPSGTPSGMPAK
jgi:hypothetical protein